MDSYLENKYNSNQKNLYIYLYQTKVMGNPVINSNNFFYSLSNNTSFTFDIIKENPLFSWNWRSLLKKSFIDLNTLQKAIDNKEMAEEYRISISENPNITLDFYFQNKDKLNWYWPF